MTRTRIIFAALLLLLLGIIACQAIEQGANSIRLALAEDQCQIFAEMAEKAATAMSEHQPDAIEAIQCLAYVHNFYPSGTKQITGSSLDSIVENSRHASEQRIIEILKSTTDFDLGNEARAWIEHRTK